MCMVSVIPKDTFSECQWNQKLIAYSESEKNLVTAKGKFPISDKNKINKTAGECYTKPSNGSCSSVVAWGVPVPEEEIWRKGHQYEKIQWTRIPGDRITTAQLMSESRSCVDFYLRLVYCPINCRVKACWFWWLLWKSILVSASASKKCNYCNDCTTEALVSWWL